MKIRMILGMFILSVSVIFAQCKKDESTKEALSPEEQTVKTYFDSIDRTKSPNELIIEAALSLLNTPYVAKTLEVNAEEQLVINLRELDCTTFVENCIALSRAAQYAHPEYNRYLNELEKIRYRNGIINGFTSRLHYTSDWIFDNVSKKIVKDITPSIGGKPLKINVYYMSSHPGQYPGLKDNPQEIQTIAEIEKQINQRNNQFYIPRDEIDKNASFIQSGDIIGFTTAIPGLDISHVAIAYWNQGKLTFIHASSKVMKVIVNPESISDYCQSIKNNTGIIVLRTLPVNN